MTYQPHHPLVEAALLLDRSIRLLLTEADALHAETWILGVARMAGTELQRSLLSEATRAGEGRGGRRFWSRHPRLVEASGDQQGRRLVAVLLASLAQLGEPMAEEAIICPPEGSAGALLNLEQTRERLGALVAACARCHRLEAAEMAEGIRRGCETDIGLSVTGIAGPTGGTATKPVGLVYWAVSHPGGTVVRDKVFQGEREEVQTAAAYAVLDLLRRIALGLPERKL